MTIRAQLITTAEVPLPLPDDHALSPLDHPAATPLDHPAATPLDQDPPSLPDHPAVPPLDHRTLQRSIPATGAPAGRYLSVELLGEIRLVALERSITHIGRGLISDVRIEDPHVSRRHAIVAVRGDGVRVLDDRSANGTFRNGHRVSISYLADGDVLRFGNTVLRYVEIARMVRERPLRRIGRGRLARGRLASQSGGPIAA